MGIEIGLALAGISALVGVVGNVAAANSANAAAAQQKNANAVSNAQAKVNNIASIRQAVREDRIRRARILAAGANSGTQGSSGEIGSISALQASLGSDIANGSEQGNTNSWLNTYGQNAADLNSQAQFISGITGGIQNGLDRFSSVFDAKPKATDTTDLFD